MLREGSGGAGHAVANELLAGHAAAAADAHRYIAVESGAAHDTGAVAIVADGIMLGGTVVPNGDVVGSPAPAHCAFDPEHIRLEEGVELLGIALRIADETLHE